MNCCAACLTALTFSHLSSFGLAARITLDALKKAIQNATTVKYPLISLTMRDRRIYLDHLQSMIEFCPTKSLVFHNCIFWESEDAMKPMKGAQISQLSDLFPSIKIIKEEKHTPKSDSALAFASDFDSGSDFES
ncbi:hypothetical protein B0J17DRAFT_57402 [Rhizoctonia solani]|nr:hypothetical protein B0J17DRAFT_57402 [Rhizoctonia solani]